jgi:hypothetical protein
MVLIITYSDKFLKSFFIDFDEGDGFFDIR